MARLKRKYVVFLTVCIVLLLTWWTSSKSDSPNHWKKTTDIEFSHQTERVSNGSSHAESPQSGNTTERGDSNSVVKKTHYKWNDASKSGWKSLPLKTWPNGSLAASGLTADEARRAVIYTRIPKTGSRSMLDLMKKSAASNRFHMIYCTTYNQSGIRDKPRFVQSVGRIGTPFLLARQLFFLDFTAFNMAQPNYLSLVRDPIARLESSFNFNRFGDHSRNKWHKLFRGNKSLTLEDCIRENKEECTDVGASVTIRYFCGQDPRCKEPSNWSVEQAMNNIRRYYIVVGLTDDYETTLKVFEKVLPSFFRGMIKFYKPPSSETKTASKKKYTASPQAKSILRERFHLEYKLYDFIKIRFYELAKRFDIIPKTR